MYKNLKCNNDKSTGENSAVSRLFSVITGLVPVILVQQVTNLVNKLALLLHKYRFSQDCRNKSGNDGCWGCRLSVCCKFLNRMYHPGHSANSLRSKPSVTGNCVGRSMIEMLGVLAIIAVLSVGGIAGFTKAMRIHRSNIQKELLVQIFANAINLRSEFFSLKNDVSKQVTDIFVALGAVPDGMTYKNEWLLDKDGNRLDVNYGIVSWKNSDGSTSSRLEYIVRLGLQHNSSMLSPSAADFCENAVFVAQQNASDIEKVTMYQYDKDSINNSKGNGFYQKKLRTITLSEVKNFCSWCNVDGYCNLYIYVNP